MNPQLIAIDWGSSNCRASLLSGNGKILEHSDGWTGVLSPQRGSFRDQLREMVEPWRAKLGTLPALVSGMAGSRNGLVEVPYLDCPAGLAALASRLWQLDPEVLPRCWLVPGLKGHTPNGLNDVMRGEEIQVLGLLERDERPTEAQLLILPGTHSKWVLVHEDEVQNFATAVSGELFALLGRDSSLAVLTHTADSRQLDDEQLRGAIDDARRPGGLLHHLFNLRVGALTGRFPPAEVRARISALLVAHEIEAMLTMFRNRPEVAVVGNHTLGPLYCKMLAYFGVDAPFVEVNQAAALGMAKLARTAGVLDEA